MNQKDIELKVREIINENLDLNKSIFKIEFSENLQSCGMNSLSAIKVIVGIEAEFYFEFRDEDLVYENFCSIEKLTMYIMSRLETDEEEKKKA